MNDIIRTLRDWCTPASPLYLAAVLYAAALALLLLLLSLVPPDHRRPPAHARRPARWLIPLLLLTLAALCLAIAYYR